MMTRKGQKWMKVWILIENQNFVRRGRRGYLGSGRMVYGGGGGLALELIKALVCILGEILVFEHEDGTAPNVLPSYSTLVIALDFKD